MSHALRRVQSIFRAALVGSTWSQYGGDRSIEKLHVEPQTALPDILDIKSQSLVEIDVAAPADLPQTGDARLNFQPFRMPQGVGICTERRRSWADKTHVSFDDVERLGQLIKAGFSQNPSDARHSGIVTDLEIRPREFIQIPELSLQLLRVSHHRP